MIGGASLWCDRWLRGHSDATHNPLVQLLACRARLSSPASNFGGVAGFSRPLCFFPARSRRAGLLPEGLPRARGLRPTRHPLPYLIASAKPCKLQASTAWSAPEEISAFYSSYTGHEPSTERKQSLERPADDEFGPIDHPGLRVANVARAGPASIPIRRRRRLRGLRKRCAGLRRSRDPLGSDRAVPVARSPA